MFISSWHHPLSVPSSTAHPVSVRGDPLTFGTQACNLSNHHIAVLDRQRVQAVPEILEPFLRLGTVHVVILPIMPPQSIQAWLWAVLLKNDFMLPDKDAELADVFVHSITLPQKVCDVNSGGGKLQVGDLPKF